MTPADADGRFALLETVREYGMERHGDARRPPDRAAIAHRVAALRSALGDAAFGDAWSEGLAMPLDAAAALARAVVAAPADALGPGDAAPSLPLTPRQRDVLRLVAAGLTDGEIADRLCLSRRTVSNHLGAILAALGVDSRRAADVAGQPGAAGQGRRHAEPVIRRPGQVLGPGQGSPGLGPLAEVPQRVAAERQGPGARRRVRRVPAR